MARLQRLPGAAFAAHSCLAVVAGVAQALSLAWPWNGAPQWGLQIVSLAVLAWLVRAPTPWRRAVWLGWAFATAWLAATFWWLFISMHTYGGLAAPLAVAAVLAFASAHAQTPLPDPYDYDEATPAPKRAAPLR